MRRRDARQEKFCQLLADKVGHFEAAGLCGYSTRHKDYSSARAKRKWCVDRVKEIMDAAERAFRMSNEGILAALVENAKTATEQGKLELAKAYLSEATKLRLRELQAAPPLLALAAPEVEPETEPEDDQAFRPLTEAQWEAMRQPPQ